MASKSSLTPAREACWSTTHACMNIRLEDADTIAISHGHFDHVGGLPIALRRERPVDVFLQAEALAPKFTPAKNGPAREIGIPAAAQAALASPPARVRVVERPTVIADGVTLTGPIPRVTSLEDTGGRFFLDAACTRPDPLIDDQALIVETARGTIVLLGCAHAGVISTLRYVRELTGGQPIFALLGGMHLVNASAKRIDMTIRELRQLKVQGSHPSIARAPPPLPPCGQPFPNAWTTAMWVARFPSQRTEPVPPLDSTRSHPRP